MTREEKIPFQQFYGEYHGHKPQHLRSLLPALRQSSDRLIWTAGDSSLDNKYWFRERSGAVGAYADILEPPRMKQDITYWLNYLCANSNSSSPHHRTAAINTAVEATTLNERTLRLRPQDIFLRDNIGSEDILIVSVGGNDIALAPLPCTILSIASLICCVPSACIENGFNYGSVPIDDCCYGCGASLCSCACACPPCLGYFKHLFGTRIQHYIEALTKKTKPAKILVCMIYYPDESRIPSWAGAALGALGYNSNPEKLQLLIRKTFSSAISSIKIRGTHVIPVPLYQVLDGKNSEDYIARVEPSAAGGRKMAEFLLNVIGDHSARSDTIPTTLPTTGTRMPPVTDYMSERS